MTDHAAPLRRVFPFGTLVRDGAVAGAWFCSDVTRCVGPDGAASPLGRRSGVRGVMRAPDGRLVGAHVGIQGDDDPVAVVGAALAAALDGDCSPVGGGRYGGRTRLATPAGQAGLVTYLADVLSRADGDLLARHASTMAEGVRGACGTPGGPAAREAALDHARARAAALRTFLDTLDPVASSLLRHHSQYMSEALGECWDGLDPARTPGAPLARALEAHPLLPIVLSSEWRRDPDALARDVAAGVPDVTASRGAARSGGLPARLAARVAEAEAAFLAMSDADRQLHVSVIADDRRDDVADAPVTLLGLLASLPPDWTPEGADEWDAFLRAAPAVACASWLVAGRDGWSTLVNAGGRWRTYLARLAAASGGVAPCDVTQDLLGVARAYADQVLLPAGALDGRLHPQAGRDDDDPWRVGGVSPSSVAYALLFSGRSLLRGLATSTAWHRAAPGVAAELAAMRGDADAPAERWPAALPPFARDGLELVVLTDDAALLAEGADADAGGLSHCVGGYGGACRSGRCRIASVRRRMTEGPSERLSTVHLEVREGALVPVEHRGTRNASPPPEAEALVRDYLARVASRELVVDHAGLAPVPGAHTIASAAGYPWHATGAWERVRDLWAPFVPRRIRGLGAADLVALADAVTFPPDGGDSPLWFATPFAPAADAGNPAPV